MSAPLPSFALWALALFCSLAVVVVQGGLTPVRVAFLTDCTMYSDWQSLGMMFSFKMSGQVGKVTKVMCCGEEKRLKYNKELLSAVETHMAPMMTVHPVTHDSYAAYNKPEAVIDWLEHVTPEEEYVLVLDSDMIQRRPFLVEEMEPRKGLAVGARYTYMIGVNNELATRHIPEVAPRNDTLAGPAGRRADQVGGFFFVHRDDLKAMSHGWLKYTEDVRADPEVHAAPSSCLRGGSTPLVLLLSPAGQPLLPLVVPGLSAPLRRPPCAGVPAVRGCVCYPPW